MQFKIRMAGSMPDSDVIGDAIREFDPSALVDIDPADQALRVAASIDAAQLAALLCRAGYAVSRHQVQPLPSECCGGCGG